MKGEENGFSVAFVYVWEPNPGKDLVKVSLDDGSIRMFLKRQKFLDLMLKVMDIDHPGTDYNYFRIKESCSRYGGHYFYDRVNDEFRELQEIPVEKRLTPKDIVEGSGGALISDRDQDRFVGLAKDLERIRTMKLEQPRSTRPSRFTSIVNRFTKKKS
jgi:hypothetical protein